MEIRRAVEKDAEILAALNKDVQALHAAALPNFFKAPSDKDVGVVSEFAAKLVDDNQLILISFVDNTPAGYVFAELQIKPETPRHPKRNVVYVHHLSVTPSFQKQGIGCALLDAVGASAKEKGVETLMLDVWTFNEDARRFFKKYGLSTFNEKMSAKL